MIQLIFESYETYWYAPFIAIPFMRYFQFLFTTIPDWDQEIERFPTPVEAWKMVMNEIIFDFFIIGIIMALLLFLGFLIGGLCYIA